MPESSPKSINGGNSAPYFIVVRYINCASLQTVGDDVLELATSSDNTTVLFSAESLTNQNIFLPGSSETNQ